MINLAAFYDEFYKLDIQFAMEDIQHRLHAIISVMSHVKMIIPVYKSSLQVFNINMIKLIKKYLRRFYDEFMVIDSFG